MESIIDKLLRENPAALMESLRRAQEALIQDNIVERTAKALHGQLVSVAQLWLGQAGACDHLSNILGITPPEGETPEKAGLGINAGP